MSSIMRRIVNITRSHAPNPEVVDNYADTQERLGSAAHSMKVLSKALSGQARTLVESSLNYGVIEDEYQLRENLLGKLVNTPAGASNPEVVSLYETAKKLRAIAASSREAAATKAQSVEESLKVVDQRHSELVNAKSKLDLAQQLTTSREKLAQIASKSDVGEFPMVSDYYVELRAATVLAREAEALAELKGLPS